MTLYKKDNLKISRKIEEYHECLICRFKLNDITCTQISLKILTKRYYKVFERSFYIQKINFFAFKNHPARLSYLEANYQARNQEYLSGYNDFQSTVTKIKNIILDRVKKDKIQSIHFHGFSFSILLKYNHLKSKIVSKSINKLPVKNQKINSSGISTNEQKSNGEKNKKKMRLHYQDSCKDSQTASMRRLTRNLSDMVRKFDDNIDKNNNLIFQMIQYQPQGIDERFKREIQKNISIIQFDQNKKPTNPEAIGNCQKDNYGLGQYIENKILEVKNMNKYIELVKKKKSANKIDNKNNLKESNCQRVQTDYDCEIIKKQNKVTKKSMQKTKKFLTSLSKGKQQKLQKIKSLGKSREVKGF